MQEMSRRKPERISPNPGELERKSDEEDWISRLPNEVIVHILSLLTVQDAMATNILSRRWRYLWTFIPSLDFDADKRVHENGLCSGVVDGTKFLRWVNQAMNAHQTETIDRFRICYDWHPQKVPDVDRWFHLAIEKRVKRFELDLSKYRGRESCLYPMHVPSQPVGFPGYESLKDLQLSTVNVSGEFLEYFLSICPMLERLSVLSSESLAELNIPGPSLSLKYLVIRDCPHMKKIEIYAENNLMSLTYSGPNISLPLKNIPHLTELFVGGDYCKFIIDNLCLFSSNLSQLEALGLDMHDIEKTTNFLHIPVLSHLKHLEVKLKARVDESLLGLTSLIKASPFLHSFALWLYSSPGTGRDRARAVQEFEKCCHRNLKVVEFFGFVGRAVDLELATYFIENASVLKKIIIDRRNPRLIGTAMQFKENMEKISARKHARLLRRKVPRGGPEIIIN